MNSSPARRGAIAAVAATIALLVTGCYRPPTGTPPGSTTTTMMDHGNDGMDHGHGGGRMPPQYDHPPTAAQLQWARQFIAATKAAVVPKYDTPAKALNDKAMQFVSLGDTVHYTSKVCRTDDRELDPTCPESLVYRGGRLIAVMYQLQENKTMADVPDLAGDLTIWHSHDLCFNSTNPQDDGYYVVGGVLVNGQCLGGKKRPVSPMLHVWVVDNPCGPFAGVDPGDLTGSCENIKL
jgi:hypothetical protein